MNRREQDEKYLKKARSRVVSLLFGEYIVICLWQLAIYLFLNQPFFGSEGSFSVVSLVCFLISAIAWLLDFFALANASRTARTVYWWLTGAHGLLAFFAFWQAFVQSGQFMAWALWGVSLLVLCVFLAWGGQWLQNSWWAGIYFDRIMVLSRTQNQHEKKRKTRRDEPQPAMQAWKPDSSLYPGQKADIEENLEPDASLVLRPSADDHADIAGTNVNVQAKARKKKSKKKKPGASYPAAALRLAFCVYGELIAFPMVMHILDQLFVSTDNKSIFAVYVMFTLCVLTAVLWTIPIFFLYLKEPSSKKAVKLSLWGQGLIMLVGAWILWQYWKSDSPDYSIFVFLWFLLFDALRLGILYHFVKACLALPNLPRHKDIDDDWIDEDEEVEYIWDDGMEEEEPEEYPDEIDEDDQLDELDLEEEVSPRGRKRSALLEKAIRWASQTDDDMDDGDEY